MENRKDPIVIKPCVSSFCNRLCEFCGLYTTDLSYFSKNKKGYMDVSTAWKISQEIGEWLKDGVRFELGGFGEPTLNKNIVEIVSLIREYNNNSQILMYSNCCNLDVYKVLRLFECGLNVLFVDLYETKYLDFINHLKKISYDYVEILDYSKSLFNPYNKSSLNKKVICYQDYTKAKFGSYNKKVKKLHNYAGNIHENAYYKYNISKMINVNKMCTRPFRELIITSDGLVPICCLDWKRELVIGDLSTKTLKEIWYSKIYDAIRYKLINKDRDFIPCLRCNNTSYRTGLIYKNVDKITDKGFEIMLKNNSEKYNKYKLGYKKRHMELENSQIMKYLKNPKTEL